MNNYVNDIKPNRRNWINNKLLYTPTDKGGLVMIRLMIDDHWAEMIGTHFTLTPDT